MVNNILDFCILSLLSEDWGKNYDLSGKYSVEWKVNRIDKHGGDFLSFGEKEQERKLFNAVVKIWQILLDQLVNFDIRWYLKMDVLSLDVETVQATESSKSMVGCVTLQFKLPLCW